MSNMSPKRLAKKVIFVGSGKGGVGKSTVSTSIAIALSEHGYHVGLLDADLYGPSIPIMLGIRRLPPRCSSSVDSKEKLFPFHKYGIKSISLGCFVDEARSVVWRGAVLHRVLCKMIEEVEWGELDFLIVDLPPGTGDIPISLKQLMEVDGALIVSTPQEVAMLDAIKAINAFNLQEIPLVGIIENMAGFRVPGTNTIYDIFGHGKAEELAYRFHVPLLASIPLIAEIRRGGDEGIPAIYHQGESEARSYFLKLADKLIKITIETEMIP